MGKSKRKNVCLSSLKENWLTLATFAGVIVGRSCHWHALSTWNSSTFRLGVVKYLVLYLLLPLITYPYPIKHYTAVLNGFTKNK